MIGSGHRPMNKLEQLSRRKQELIEQCARERIELEQALGTIRSSVTLYGAMAGLGRILLTHPLVAAAISSLLASGYARKFTKSGSDLLKLLRVARPLWAWWSKRRRREAKLM